MKKKLSEDDIKTIKELYKKGISKETLARKYKVTVNTIVYWIDDKARERRKARMRETENRLYREGKQWRDKHPEKAKKYIRDYMRTRYQTDPEFRARMNKYSREYQRKARAEGRTWKQRNPEQEKKTRHEYYIKNKKRLIAQSSEWCRTHREHINKRSRERYATDPEYRAKIKQWNKECQQRKRRNKK